MENELIKKSNTKLLVEFTPAEAKGFAVAIAELGTYFPFIKEVEPPVLAYAKLLELGLKICN